MTALEIVQNINQEDQKVALRVSTILPKISDFIDACYEKMQVGGRLFYIGAGTSGRLGILDASECPPTFGVGHDLVIGWMAGGDTAMRKAVEFAEDDTEKAWIDLAQFEPTALDTLVGIAASGTTPYVIGGIKAAREKDLLTAAISCNPGSPIGQIAEYALEVDVDPEFITGSTRMKSGTAQKMILNMISTALMVKLGRVKDNKMIDMQLSNNKLIERGIGMIKEKTKWPEEKCKAELLSKGSVRAVLEAYEE